MGLTAAMFLRAVFPVCLLLFLTACGFRPLYGGLQADARLAEVALAAPEGRTGQQLALLLSDRFYGARPATAQPLWTLQVTTQSTREDLGIRRDDVATRARLTLTASFSLTRAGEKTPVLAGSERSFVSYNIFSDPYATVAAEQNAQERGLVQLADLITSRVALYLAGNSSGSAAP